jgi:hypothetical protein
MHCDTTFNIFNSEQIAAGVGITDVLHKLPSTAVFITQAEGLDADKYKETRRKVSERRAPRREGPLVYVGLGRGPANTDQSDEGNLRR